MMEGGVLKETKTEANVRTNKEADNEKEEERMIKKGRGD